MHVRGMRTSDIAKALGIDWTTARRWIDPEYAARRLEMNRAAAARRQMKEAAE